MSAKAELAAIFAGSVKVVVMVENTTNLVVGSLEFVEVEVLKIINKGLKAFKRVEFMGVAVWRHWEVIHNPQTDEYVWDESFNKVKGNIVEYRKEGDDGPVTSEIVGSRFRTWE